MDAGNCKNGSTESTVQAYRADGCTHVGLYECRAVKGEGGGRGVFSPKQALGRPGVLRCKAWTYSLSGLIGKRGSKWGFEKLFPHNFLCNFCFEELPCIYISKHLSRVLPMMFN
jgi:uncharacterized protein YodC (DUF2158 family)